MSGWAVTPSNDYPADWQYIALEAKAAAGWRCVRCGHSNDRKSGHVLTVHHMDGDKSNCAWWNLAALCQRCHLRIQGRVNPDRPWVLEHSNWYKPYVAGFYAWKYLGAWLSREAIEADLDYYLGLERSAVLGASS